MKTTTIRIDENLDNRLTAYAKKHDLSRNQVIKTALRSLFATDNTNKTA